MISPLDSLPLPLFCLEHYIHSLDFAVVFLCEGHCATSRKVAGSIPNDVIGIFRWHNPSGRTVALGSTQSLTEMTTRNISWGVKAADAWNWQPYHLYVPTVMKSGTFNLMEPSGPLQGLHFFFVRIRVSYLCWGKCNQIVPASRATAIFVILVLPCDTEYTCCNRSRGPRVYSDDVRFSLLCLCDFLTVSPNLDILCAEISKHSAEGLWAFCTLVDMERARSESSAAWLKCVSVMSSYMLAIASFEESVSEVSVIFLS